MTKTLNDFYIEYTKILKSEIESRELCAYALDLDRNKRLDWAYLYIGEESEQKIHQIMQRMLDGEPVAYILGEWEFYSLPFKVTTSILIPRQDTETLVDSAIKFLKTVKKDHLKVLDLCCGSGCIGISILKNIPNSKVVACDISKEAVEISRYNSKLNNVSERYTAVEYDIFYNKKNLGQFDLIVSNPPYIKTDDIETLDIDVKKHEPHLALDGGADGYDFYKAILEKFTKNLNPNGKIIFEYGISQETEIEKIMRNYDLENIEIKKDLCEVNRIIEATKISR